MALILAGVIFIATLAFCALMAFAAGMSDSQSTSSNNVVLTFVTGTILAVLVGASHWMPHVGW